MSTKPVVLLLEDHTELGEVIRDLMTAEGYDVLAVRDQSAALATLRAQSVDLVIADLPTPRPGEADPLADIVREFEEVPRITLVDDVKRGPPIVGPWRMFDGHAALRRPFKLDDLLTLAHELVGGRGNA